MSSQALPAHSKHLFRYLFEHASLGIAVEDLDGRLLLANPALCLMLGYREKELCGMSCSEFGNPEDSRDDWALFQRLRAGLIDQYSMEKRYLRKDGAPRWGRLNVSLLNDGNEGSSSLVFAFLQDITEYKQTEAALRESEQRLRLAVRAGRMYAFDWDLRTDVISRSEECGDILDWMDDPEHETGQSFYERVHPDDREVYTAAEAGLTPENPTYRTNFRVVRPDGSVIWLEDTGRASFNTLGKILRVTGMVADVTARNLAEAALANVSRKLIEAQEQERARIGRELHDDIGQRLALLAAELQQLQENPLIVPEVRSRVGELEKQISEIASDIQLLSHELHSAKLQYLGIAGAVRGFCREFSEQQKVEIDVKTDALPALSPEISLCLFRVLQEGLHNSAKHSGVRHFEVRLRGTADEIHLTVKDSGVGFDREQAKMSQGLGLVSMEERLKLVNGTLAIETQPNGGATIHARVPVESDSVRAAG
jgi:PAS domain S-box-containing protein